MKFLAIYLPAFHQIKENDKWWGKGFTEWDNVKSGKKYYKGHVQPLEPYNDNYYNLSKKKDIEDQINLANKYGVDGFVFYHYWFGNDHLLFEKPAEILKNEINKQIEYCFCWANETWQTTWHGLQPKELMPQVYEGEKDWKKHIEYFIPFFKDKRYIKIKNRPVLFIYRAKDIPDYEKMIDYWNQILKKHNLEPIYIIEYISTKNKELSSLKSDGVYEFEPLYTTYFDINIFNKFKRFLCKKFHQIDYQNYNSLWRKNVRRKRTYSNKTIYKGCFCSWDNSARKEKNSMIVKNSNPIDFEKNLKKLCLTNRKNTSSDYIIINAWNEWSEGAMLEPSKKDKYDYLEAIQKVKKEINKM